MLGEKDDRLLRGLYDLQARLEASRYRKTAGCLVSTICTLRTEMKETDISKSRKARHLNCNHTRTNLPMG